MVFTGNFISAQDALRSGLISRVVARDNLEEETNSVVNAICSKSKSVLALGKKFFYEQMRDPLEIAYRKGSEVMVENLSLADAQE
ncbi:Enoyl-CoA hydratase domain-containing protein 3-like protein, partial [Dinothrombium tinctorium]